MTDVTKLKQQLEYYERRQRANVQRFTNRPQDDDHFLWSMVDVISVVLIFFIMLYATSINKVNPPVPEKKAVVQNTAEPDLKDDISELVAANSTIAVRWDKSRPILMLGEHITFEQGKADLITASEATLTELAQFIAARPEYNVIVAGHTDDLPIQTEQFPSNWELSSARAVSVVRFLADHGVAPQRLSVQGYAEYAPLHSDPANRQTNRRVEISLVKKGL